MLTALAVLGGFGLDLLLADPAWMPHPVVLMGKVIARLERLLRRLFPDTPAGQLAAGRVLAAVLPLGTFALTAAVCALAYWVHPVLGFGVELVWCWQALALRGLADESSRVYPPLKAGDLPAARRQVSRIVGRDTAALTSEGVAKAAVETVAENFSDGVLAPLLYLLIGGAPLGLAYKAINTMDSMVGYKNEKYLYFGRAAAHLDDAANWVPSRAAAAGAMPAPTRPRPNRPAPGPWGSSWLARPGISGNIMTSPPSATPIARWSPRTFCGPTTSSIWRAFWPWGWVWPSVWASGWC